MAKGFVIGFVLGVLGLMGFVYWYFGSGKAPVAVTDHNLPFERTLAHKALDARIDSVPAQTPPIPADEPNYLAGAEIYRNNCAVCHGLPNQAPTAISQGMYPKPPQLFRGKGVTDDPASETYWKATNGIRMTGMPGFRATLSDTQLWQVSQLLANADKIPDSVKKALAPDVAPAK
jgi:thiosulfate dehydrogenase